MSINTDPIMRARYALLLLCSFALACNDNSAPDIPLNRGYDRGTDIGSIDRGLGGDSRSLISGDGALSTPRQDAGSGRDLTDVGFSNRDQGKRPAGDVSVTDASVNDPRDTAVDQGTEDAHLQVDAFGPPWNQRFDDVVFAATHNSYSGHERGTIIEQLNTGVRMLELDFHVAGFRDDDWRLGHGRPGSEVEEGNGNPDSDRLTPWLQLIAGWSRMNPHHAPITIALDSKSVLSQTDGPEEGNLGALNQRLVSIFGDRLVWGQHLGPRWPRLHELRGKILIVLTGNREDRQAYQRDQGIEASIAVNDRGKVIEIHSSDSRELWYWTGEIDPDRGVLWWHHGRYDTGMQPAVLLTNDGVVIDIHKTHRDDDRLWSAVGIMDAQHVLRWNDAHEIGSGEQPTLRRLADGRIRAIFLHDGQRKTMLGELNADRTRVIWTAPINTEQAPFNNRRSGPLEVLIQADRFAPASTLQYRFDGGDIRRLTYAQIMHTEFQLGDGNDELEDSARFFALQGNGSSANAVAALLNRGPVRVWGYNESRIDDRPIPSFPATDFPFSAWYRRLMNVADAVDWNP